MVYYRGPVTKEVRSLYGTRLRELFTRWYVQQRDRHHFDALAAQPPRSMVAVSENVAAGVFLHEHEVRCCVDEKLNEPVTFVDPHIVTQRVVVGVDGN